MGVSCPLRKKSLVAVVQEFTHRVLKRQVKDKHRNSKIRLSFQEFGT